jgi:ABC-type Zn uptake system ZnuABC Zn-binding protein ZnuA
VETITSTVQPGKQQKSFQDVGKSCSSSLCGDDFTYYMPVSRVILCVGAVCLAAWIALGCDQSSSTGSDPMAPSATPAAVDPREDEPVRIVATVYALGDLARQVGGKYADVEWVIETGRSLSGFEPSREVRDRIGRAELIVAGGADEPWAVSEAPSALTTHRILRLDTLNVDVPAPVAKPTWPGDASVSGGLRVGLPWLDPRVLSAAVDATGERLVVLRPRHDVYFRSRAQRLKQELDLITDSHADELARFSRRRVLALTYEFDGLAGRMSVGVTHPVVGTADRLSDGQIGELRSAVRREQLPVVLVRADTPPALVADLSQRTGARLFTIDPYGSSASDSGRSTVQEFLKYNLDQLVEAVKAAQ